MKYLPGKDKTRVAVIVTLTLVFLVVIYLLLNPAQRPSFFPKTIFNPESQPSSLSAPSSQAQVKITDQGFIPATLMVKKDTQVTWIVSDTKPHQIASDPHPSHNSLPALFQSQPSQSSYSYTFTKEGTFTYHDETNPLKLKGTIIVE